MLFRSQANGDLQKVLANICQARTLHGVPMPDGWMVVSTGNKQADRAGANRVLSHLRNRETVIDFDTHLDDWTQWALDNDHTDIHLWGFDSIWADTQETKTDELVHRDRQQHDLYIHWREKWKPFTKYNITVHNTKEGTQLKDLICQ